MAKYVKTEDGYQEIEAVNSNRMDKNNPVGTGSFSMGRKDGSVIGDSSHAEGSNTTASGSSSHAEGNGTTASNYGSHAEGSNTKASGYISHAEGSNTTASGNYSHAEGSNTTASGHSSHAEGNGTTAFGDYSHAEGNGTTAFGDYSHAEGVHTEASSTYQHTQGKFNIKDSSGTYAHIVGNGTNDTARSNAHTLDWSGNAWYAGDVYVGGSDQSTGEKLATKNELPKRPVAQLVTLSASEWDADTKSQTITVFGVLADESAQLVTSTPLTMSARAYINAGVVLTGREDDTVTFTAETIPIEDIKLYVVRQEIESGECLAFSSPEPFSIAVSQPGWDGTMEYSTDATRWTTWRGESISTVENNGKYSLYFRGTGNTIVSGSQANNWTLAGSNISCDGNIETLLDHIMVGSGKHPTMANSCYCYMFNGCTSLTTAPALPATTLAMYCYSNMFSGCTSLVTAPALPATTLSDYCYSNMFKGCTSLTTAPALPATTLTYSCYKDMFSGCTSLVTAPALPATTLAEDCYYSMFLGCTSLTTAPSLPATKLEVYCYFSMFYGCTSLKLSSTQTEEYTVAYRIPANGTGTIANSTMTTMFSNTGGTFTGAPAINTTYYLHKDNSIVQ